MMENTNQTNYGDIFVDTNDNNAEKVMDSNSFYDDFIDSNSDDNYVSNSSYFNNSDDNNFIDPFDDSDEVIPSKPITKLEFDSKDGMPIETNVSNDTSSIDNDLFSNSIQDEEKEVVEAPSFNDFINNAEDIKPIEKEENIMESKDLKNSIKDIEIPEEKNMELTSNDKKLPEEKNIELASNDKDLELSNKEMNIKDEELLSDLKDEDLEELDLDDDMDNIDDFNTISNPIVDNKTTKEEVVEDKKEEFNPFELSSLSDDDMDKMIEEDSKKEELDDSYVLSNFDVLFDSLYNDVNGANNFISNLIEQKKNVNLNEATLKEEAEKLLKEREEFAKYMQIQKESIETEKKQCKEFVKTQKIRLQNEEEKFNNDMEAAKAERKLAEESLKIEEQKLEHAKEQFEKEKEIEQEKLKTAKEKLEVEKQQFEKEKEIELEKIKSDRKELQSQKEQFAKTKELEEKKLELESKNLSQSCARFKELVSQFNSGFQQLPEDK